MPILRREKEGERIEQLEVLMEMTIPNLRMEEMEVVCHIDLAKKRLKKKQREVRKTKNLRRSKLLKKRQQGKLRRPDSGQS